MVLETAIVKSVLSGDTLCLRGKPVSGPPPEKLFSLANVMAPRLNLKEPEKEEVGLCFGWTLFHKKVPSKTLVEPVKKAIDQKNPEGWLIKDGDRRLLSQVASFYESWWLASK